MGCELFLKSLGGTLHLLHSCILYDRFRAKKTFRRSRYKLGCWWFATFYTSSQITKKPRVYSCRSKSILGRVHAVKNLWWRKLYLINSVYSRYSRYSTASGTSHSTYSRYSRYFINLLNLLLNLLSLSLSLSLTHTHTHSLSHTRIYIQTYIHYTYMHTYIVRVRGATCHLHSNEFVRGSCQSHPRSRPPATGPAHPSHGPPWLWQGDGGGAFSGTVSQGIAG